MIAGLPATMSLDYLFRSDLIWGSTMQPAGSVVALAALTWGLGRRKALSELSNEDGEVPRWANVWFFWVRYVVPIAVITALASGWILN